MAKKKHGQRKLGGKSASNLSQAKPRKLYLIEAVDVIREELIQHRLSGRKTLWPTILKQIAKQDSFDGHYADTILEAIRSFLKPLNDPQIISLWRQTETGMGDEAEDDCIFPQSARMELEMELLHEITRLAWEEGKEDH